MVLIVTISYCIYLGALPLHHLDGAGLEVLAMLCWEDLQWGILNVIISQIISCLALIILIDSLDDVSFAGLRWSPPLSLSL